MGYPPRWLLALLSVASFAVRFGCSWSSCPFVVAGDYHALGLQHFLGATRTSTFQRLRNAPSFSAGTRRRRSGWCNTTPRVATAAAAEDAANEAGDDWKNVASEQDKELNRFNVPVEEAVQQWSAQLKRKSSARFRSEETVVLGVRNATAYMVDTLSFCLPTEGGLGLILTEIAGGRSDGLGITIVSELVAGGNAARYTNILPGDSIVALERTQKRKNAPSSSTTTTTESVLFGDPNAATAADSSSSMLSQEEETTVISTECLGYDATVDAIANLPRARAPEQDEALIVTVKRIRQRPRIQVHVQYPPTQKVEDVTLELFAGENLRRALLIRGVRLEDPLAQQYYQASSGGGATCGSHATCGVCAVAIVRTTEGMTLSPPPSSRELQLFRPQHPQWRMACRLVVGADRRPGEMVIQVNPQEWME